MSYQGEPTRSQRDAILIATRDTLATEVLEPNITIGTNLAAPYTYPQPQESIHAIQLNYSYNDKKLQPKPTTPHLIKKMPPKQASQSTPIWECCDCSKQQRDNGYPNIPCTEDDDLFGKCRHQKCCKCGRMRSSIEDVDVGKDKK